ncbi:hypothetical protein ACQP2E_15770 [Actinoplanes sp. CA-015351]|uniref:hypothetical protein n=1 Tax=Actinoplanes sp. CA-015351 TaxID=3239897 RepID=UPI003D9743FA
MAFVALTATPSYSAPRAAIHMLSESIRLQLAGTNVEVVPPSVATDLLPGQKESPIPMPLDAFVAEVVDLLATRPDTREIQVERVIFLRYAEKRGEYDTVVAAINQHDPHGK